MIFPSEIEGMRTDVNQDRRDRGQLAPISAQVLHLRGRDP